MQVKDRGELQPSSISVGKPSLQLLTSYILQHRRVSTGEKASRIVILTPYLSIRWYAVFSLHPSTITTLFILQSTYLCSSILKNYIPKPIRYSQVMNSVSTDPTFPEAGARLTSQSNRQSIAMQSHKVASQGLIETTLHTTGGVKPGRPEQVFFKQQQRWLTWIIRRVQYTCMEQRLSQIITREKDISKVNYRCYLSVLFSDLWFLMRDVRQIMGGNLLSFSFRQR